MERQAGQLPIFTYVTVDKAEGYRRVMRAFLDAKESFRLHLRPAEVHQALLLESPAAVTTPASGQPDVLGGHRAPGEVAANRHIPSVDDPQPPGPDEVQALLAKLVGWGNLRADPDTAEVATVEEFNRPRFLYQLTAEGEAAERALRHFDDTLHKPGELQTTALADIRQFLHELLGLATGERDAGKVHRTLLSLTDRFEELTDQAQRFIGGLQRTVDLHQVDIDAFLAYKDRLIEYLKRFIGDLVVAQAEIARLVGDVEEAGVAPLLDVAAARDLENAVEATDRDRVEASDRWRKRWQGLRAWFLAPAGEASQSDVLRARARAAIPALLLAVSQINERRVSRADRAADLRTLAGWFAQAPTDGDAHRLWRAAFGLTAARHLAVDEETQDARDAAPVPPATSWLDDEPVRISPQLRKTGRYVRRGRPSTVIDRSREKALLARQAEEEAAQTAAARRRLATRGRVRLSELGELDRDAFGLFLDLLGEALAVKVRPGETVSATTADGTVTIVLEPTGDGATATITTSDGDLHGPDHHITIVDLLVGDAVAVTAVLADAEVPV